MFTSRLAVIVVATLLAGASLCPAAAPPYVLRDADGEPLPLGAVARLGTLRLFHPVQVDFKAFTPDRRFLITAMYDADGLYPEANRFHVWDLSTGRLVRRFGPDTRGTSHAVQSPGGRHIVSVGPAGTFLWEVPSGRLVRQLEKERELDWNDRHDQYTFRDEKTLVALRKNWVETLDLATGRRVGRVRLFELEKGFGAPPMFLSPDGKTVVKFGDDGIELIDTATAKSRARGSLDVREDLGESWSWTFHPNGKVFAVVGEKGIVQIHDAATLRKLREWKLGGRLFYNPLDENGPHCAFVPGGNLLATPGPNRSPDLWDWTGGRFVRNLGPSVDIPEGLAFSLDGKVVANGRSSGRIAVCDVATGKELLPFEGHCKSVRSIRYIDKDSLISTTEWGGSVTWDVRTGRVVRSVAEGQRSYGEVISPDGKVRACPHPDGTVLLLDSTTGKKLRLLGFSQPRPQPGLWEGMAMVLSWHRPVAFSPDGSVLAYAELSGPIRLWSVATGKEHGRLGKWPERMGVNCLTVSPDGRFLAAGGSGADGRVEVWDTATGKLLLRVTVPVRLQGTKGFFFGGGVEAVAFTGDERAVAAVSSNGVVRVWEVSSGRQLFGFDPKEDDRFPFYTAVACSPDGRLVASARAEGVILVWEVASGREVARFHSTGGRAVRALAFSPDGRTLASGGEDVTILLWEVPDLVRRPRR